MKVQNWGGDARIYFLNTVVQNWGGDGATLRISSFILMVIRLFILMIVW